MSAYSFLILSCLVAVARCQVDSREAAILRDMRYLSGDGNFGAAYSQEDGIEFKEESDEYGNRRGSYSYVDPTGQRRTVHYTAGVNGFQASGDHIPAQPPPVPPKPQYAPQPQYNPPDYVPPQAQPAPPRRPPRYQIVPRPYEPQYETQEPLYEPQPQPTKEPRFRDVSPRLSSPRRHRPLQPAQPEVLQYQSLYGNDYSAVYNPQYESKYDIGPTIAPLPPQQHQHHQHPRRHQYNPVIRPTIAPAPPSPLPAALPLTLRYHLNDITTPAPRRFYPPGKLDFNRTPDGFSYTFSKN